MPVLDPNPLFVSIDSLPDTEGVVWEIGRHRTFSKKYLVRVKLKSMGPIDVALCPGLPLAGSFYLADPNPGGQNLSGDRAAMMVRMSAARRDPADAGAWEWWVVTCDYSTDIPFRSSGFTGPGDSDQHDQELADVSWDFEEQMVARPHDLRGRPYLTPARHPYSPPMMTPTAYPVVSISRNESSFNYQKASKVAYALNDEQFLQAPRGCVQILPPKSQQKNTGQLRYQRVSYRLKFRPLQANGGYTIPVYGGFIYEDGTVVPCVSSEPLQVVDSWQPTVLCQDLYELGNLQKHMPELKNKPVPIMVNGVVVTHPRLLDDKGQIVDLDPDFGPPRAWFQRFQDFRYQNIKDLLVTGLS